MESTLNRQLPWYKQFWPWFVFGLPGITVIAGITTVIISIYYADSLVADDYYKEGLAINANLKKENLAQELGLSMDFFIDKQKTQVAVELHNPQAVSLPSMLQLKLVHPVDSDFDMTFPLVFDKVTQRYTQKYSSMQDINWLLEVEPLYPDINPDESLAWKIRTKRNNLEHNDH